MLLTEDAMAGFRAAELEKPRSGTFPFLMPRGPALPETAFSDPAEVFGEDWTPPVASGLHEDVRNALKVVAVLAFRRGLPRLNFDRPWWSIRHQCRGYSNQQIEMIATRIALRPAIIEPLSAIARDGHFAEMGLFNTHELLASRLARYVAALDQIGLNCEASWRHLREGVYPIDATQENLDALSDDPPDLRSVVDWGGSPPARCSDDPAILVIAQNSD